MRQWALASVLTVLSLHGIASVCRGDGEAIRYDNVGYQFPGAQHFVDELSAADALYSGEATSREARLGMLDGYRRLLDWLQSSPASHSVHKRSRSPATVGTSTAQFGLRWKIARGLESLGESPLESLAYYLDCLRLLPTLEAYELPLYTPPGDGSYRPDVLRVPWIAYVRSDMLRGMMLTFQEYGLHAEAVEVGEVWLRALETTRELLLQPDVPVGAVSESGDVGWHPVWKLLLDYGTVEEFLGEFAKAYLWLGHSYWESGEYEQAQRYYTRWRQVRRVLANCRTPSDGVSSGEARLPDGSEVQFRATGFPLSEFRQWAGRPPTVQFPVAWVRVNAQEYPLRWEDADVSAEQALAEQKVRDLEEQGDQAGRDGNHLEAAQAYDEAAAICRHTLVDPLRSASLSQKSAQALLDAQTRVVEALQRAQESFRVFQRLKPNGPEAASAASTLAHALIANQLYSHALRAAQSAYDCYRVHESGSAIHAYSASLVGLLRAECSDTSGAARFYEEALSVAGADEHLEDRLYFEHSYLAYASIPSADRAKRYHELLYDELPRLKSRFPEKAFPVLEGRLWSRYARSLLRCQPTDQTCPVWEQPAAPLEDYEKVIEAYSRLLELHTGSSLQQVETASAVRVRFAEATDTEQRMEDMLLEAEAMTQEASVTHLGEAPVAVDEQSLRLSSGASSGEPWVVSVPNVAVLSDVITALQDTAEVYLRCGEPERAARLLQLVMELVGPYSRRTDGPWRLLPSFVRGTYTALARCMTRLPDVPRDGDGTDWEREWEHLVTTGTLPPLAHDLREAPEKLWGVAFLLQAFDPASHAVKPWGEHLPTGRGRSWDEAIAWLIEHDGAAQAVLIAEYHRYAALAWHLQTAWRDHVHLDAQEHRLFGAAARWLSASALSPFDKEVDLLGVLYWRGNGTVLPRHNEGALGQLDSLVARYWGNVPGVQENEDSARDMVRGSFDALAGHLREEQALVYYVTAFDDIWAIVLRRDHPPSITKIGAKGSDVASANASIHAAMSVRAQEQALPVQRLRRWIRTRGHATSTGRDQMDQLRRSLYRDLVAPIEGHLTDSRELVFCLPDEWADAPMHILMDAEGASLIDRWDIAYIASLRTWLLAKTQAGVRAPRASGITYFTAVGGTPGAVEYLGVWNDRVLPSQADALTELFSVGSSARTRRAGMRRIPNTRREIRESSRLFPTSQIILPARDATPDGLAAALRSQPRIVHVASHGFVGAERTSWGLLLRPSDHSQTGLFQAQHIPHPCSADLVILSACDTAAGHVLPGEGLLTMAYDWHSKGAKSVVATLWPASDDVSASMVVSLIRRVADGETTSRALSEAIREAKRANPDRPEAWGPLVLYGMATDLDALETTEADARNWTPLHAAATRDDVEGARLLLERGADVNARDVRNGFTPLHFAPSDEMAALLLEWGADVGLRTYHDGATPLHTNAAYADTMVCTYLLGHGADVNAKSQRGETPLHWAALNGRTQTVSLLLGFRASVHARCRAGSTPLHRAAMFGHTETCALLLDRGADVNARDDEGRTPLHEGALAGHAETVALLLERGADVNAVGLGGRTALHIAVGQAAVSPSEMHADIVSVLLDNGARADAQDASDYTPLHAAASWGACDILDLMFKRGWDVNARTADGRTPLHAAAVGGHTRTTRLLIRRGADVVTRTDGGATPLHHAAQFAHPETAALLLRLGAEVDARDAVGSTPLHWVAATAAWPHRLEQISNLESRVRNTWDPLATTAGVRQRLVQTARLLLERGADVNARDEGGRTPLAVAASGGDSAIVPLLREHGGVE